MRQGTRKTTAHVAASAEASSNRQGRNRVWDPIADIDQRGHRPRLLAQHLQDRVHSDIAMTYTK